MILDAKEIEFREAHIKAAMILRLLVANYEKPGIITDMKAIMEEARRVVEECDSAMGTKLLEVLIGRS